MSPDASSTPTTTPAPFDFDWVPAQFKGKPEEFGREFAKDRAAQAAEQIRKNANPQNPDAYELKTSKAFKPPEGVQFNINANDPLWSQARAWAHKNGLSQQAFEEGIDLIAGRDVGSEQTFAQQRNAEMAKLGTTATARIDALGTWMGALIGEQGAKTLGTMLVSAAIVQEFEKLASKFTTQGAAPFSQAHRVEPNQPGRVSDDDYNRMSQAERWEYARSFDQKQFHDPNRQNGRG